MQTMYCIAHVPICKIMLNMDFLCPTSLSVIDALDVFKNPEAKGKDLIWANAGPDSPSHLLQGSIVEDIDEAVAGRRRTFPARGCNQQRVPELMQLVISLGLCTSHHVISLVCVCVCVCVGAHNVFVCECFAGWLAACLAWLLRIVCLPFCLSCWFFVLCLCLFLSTCFCCLVLLSFCASVRAPFNCGFDWSLPKAISLACLLPSLLAQWAFVIVGVSFHLVLSGGFLCPFPLRLYDSLPIKSLVFRASVCALVCAGHVPQKGIKTFSHQGQGWALMPLISRPFASCLPISSCCLPIGCQWHLWEVCNQVGQWVSVSVHVVKFLSNYVGLLNRWNKFLYHSLHICRCLKIIGISVFSGPTSTIQY